MPQNDAMVRYSATQVWLIVVDTESKPLHEDSHQSAYFLTIQYKWMSGYMYPLVPDTYL